MARLKKKSVMPDKKEKELKEVLKNEIIIEDSSAIRELFQASQALPKKVQALQALPSFID